MELAIHPLILIACLVGFGATIAGILYLLGRISGSSTSKASTVLCGYLAAFVTYCGSLYAGVQMNPRAMVDGSWSDPYLQATTLIGFLVCLILPFRLPIPALAHAGVALVNWLVLGIAFFLWFSKTA